MKITLKEWLEIGQYLPVRKPFQHMCSFQLVEGERGELRRECWVKWHWYLLLFLPINLLNMCICFWDGGLKAFEVTPRKVSFDWLPIGSKCYNTAKKILEEKKNS